MFRRHKSFSKAELWALIAANALAVVLVILDIFFDNTLGRLSAVIAVINIGAFAGMLDLLSRRLPSNDEMRAACPEWDALQVFSGASSKEGIAVTVKNTGEKAFAFAGECRLEQYRSGKWMAMAPVRSDAKEGAEIPSGGTLAVFFDWKDTCGTLDFGNYRVVFEVCAGAGEKALPVYVPFLIDGE